MSEFEKIIGYTSIKVELQRICDIIKNPDKYRKLGVKYPKGIILYGDPGVGKTLISKCFMRECGVKCFIVRKDKPDGDFVNYIKQSFDEARKNQPSIVLLDDLDKFANEDIQHKDAAEYVAVQSCIDDSKDDKVFVLATVNNLLKIPDSLTRAGRFDNKICIKRPVGKDAEEIIRYYLGQKEYVKDIDAEEIHRILDGCSCAELEMIINNAGMYAGVENKDKIEMQDIIKACLRHLFNAPNTYREINARNNEQTAYHEVGHAVVAEILEPNSVSLISIDEHDGSIEGLVSCYRPNDISESINTNRIDITRALAGRAQVELKYGVLDMGCGSDIDHADILAFRLVERYALNGFCNYGITYGMPSTTKERMKLSSAFELDRCYMEAKRILANNIEFVENLVKALLKKKTLRHCDIQEIKARSNIKE